MPIWLARTGVFAASLVALLWYADTGNATTVGTLATVSGPSPYAACTIGGTPSSTAYANAEVEPYLAVNPTNQANLIGVWQQDRWNDGGSHGLVAGFSFNGGVTWGETALPFDRCAPGGLPFERASDPWVSIGPDGTAYANAITFDASDNNNGVAAAVSTNGGRTWTHAQTVIADTGGASAPFNDKNSITANPVRAGFAYQVWDRLASVTSAPDAKAHASTGSTYFSMTTDGGTTWSTPKVILATKVQTQTIDNQILVDPSHPDTLYDVASWLPKASDTAHGRYTVAVVKSTDGGATWSAPQVIADQQSVGVADPNTGFPVRDGSIIPEPAIGPSGELYVVWQDARFSGGTRDEVAFSRSTDGGATWSTPKRISTATGAPAFLPTVKVSADGTVGVTYYDFRNLQPGNTTTLPTDYWFISSRDGGTTFSADTHITGSFDLLLAPVAGGVFLGDYQGLATSGASTFHPFFVATTCPVPSTTPCSTANRTDVYTTAITP
jgi:hypothetical protein